ncbi:MAG: hypothetical protein IKY98_02935 [Alphaproteobacteria bacterium]|nr:hypothetical protein [Alphaproteobacteria bacterium]
MSNSQRNCDMITENGQTNKILELARCIKPLVSFRGRGQIVQGLHFVRESDILWHNYAPYPIECAENLQEEGVIQVKHTPTVEPSSIPTTYEVLSQIPEEFQRDIVAFNVKKAVGRVPDFENKRVGYMVDVVLYSGKLPLQVAEQPVIINGIVIPTPKPLKHEREICRECFFRYHTR